MTLAADGLHVELEELAVATLLWAVVAKHRTDEKQSCRLRQLVEVAFEVRADNARGGLGTQCELSPAAVLETVELFGDGVGVLANALDQLGRLDHGRHDLLVAEAPRHVRRGLLGHAPGPAVLRKDVAHSTDGPDRFVARHKSDDCKNLPLLSVAGDHAPCPDRLTGACRTRLDHGCLPAHPWQAAMAVRRGGRGGGAARQAAGSQLHPCLRRSDDPDHQTAPRRGGRGAWWVDGPGRRDRDRRRLARGASLTPRRA